MHKEKPEDAPGVRYRRVHKFRDDGTRETGWEAYEGEALIKLLESERDAMAEIARLKGDEVRELAGKVKNVRGAFLDDAVALAEAAFEAGRLDGERGGEGVSPPPEAYQEASAAKSKSEILLDRMVRGFGNGTGGIGA